MFLRRQKHTRVSAGAWCGTWGGAEHGAGKASSQPPLDQSQARIAWMGQRSGRGPPRGGGWHRAPCGCLRARAFVGGWAQVARAAVQLARSVGSPRWLAPFSWPAPPACPAGSLRRHAPLTPTVGSLRRLAPQLRSAGGSLPTDLGRANLAARGDTADLNDGDRRAQAPPATHEIDGQKHRCGNGASAAGLSIPEYSAHRPTQPSTRRPRHPSETP